MSQTQTDLAALTAATLNVYEHAGPADTFLGDAVTALGKTPPDVATALTYLSSAEEHVAFMAFQAADAQASATALNADLNPPAPPPPVTALPPLSIYTGSSSAAGSNGLAKTLHVTADGCSIYCDGTSYASIGSSGSWATSDAAPLPLFLSVNLCPGGQGLSTVPANVGTFTTLAKSLKAGTVCRPGWEFNGNWFPWGNGAVSTASHDMVREHGRVLVPQHEDGTEATSLGNTPAEFATSFADCVTAMRAGNPNLKFDWCSNAGGITLAQLETYYPGDAYVDYIGCDIYDQGSLAANVAAITPTIQMAAAHNKPVSIGEFGAAGNGTDDPAYVDFMGQLATNPAAFAAAHGLPEFTVAYTSLFTDSSNNITNKPNMIAEFPKAFAGE